MWLTRSFEAIAGLVPVARRFFIVGVVASAVHFAVATLLIGRGMGVLAANCSGFAVALVVSLVGHHRYSFDRRAPFWRAARRFIPGAAVGFIANNLVLGGLVLTTGEALAWLKVAVAILVIPPATFAYAHLFAYRAERQ